LKKVGALCDFLHMILGSMKEFEAPVNNVDLNKLYQLKALLTLI
jgi:hypothetical protein